VENLRRLGGGAGILAGIAAAWLLVRMTVIFPARQDITVVIVLSAQSRCS